MQCFTMNDSDEYERLELTMDHGLECGNSFKNKKPRKCPVNKRYLQELIVCTPYYLLGIKAVDTKVINTSVALIHITTTRASLLPLFEKRMPIV